MSSQRRPSPWTRCWCLATYASFFCVCFPFQNKHWPQNLHCQPCTCPQEQLPTSLLKLSTENTGRAIKMFNAILKYQSEGGESPERLELVQKLLHQGLKRGELRDELFMQLLKQTRANPSIQSRARGWELLFLVASTMSPSKDFVGLVSQYIHDTAHDAGVPGNRMRGKHRASSQSPSATKTNNSVGVGWWSHGSRVGRILKKRGGHHSSMGYFHRVWLQTATLSVFV